MEQNSSNSNLGGIEEEIRQALSEGPKRAKEIVRKVSAATGKKEPTIFYWLKKLQGSGKIQKVGERYQWVEFEEARREEVEFCLDMLKGGSPEQVEAAQEDFLQLSRTRKVGHLPEVRSFLEEAVGRCYGEGLRDWALLVLSFIARLSRAARDEGTLRWMREQKEKFLELAKDEKLSESARERALWVLDEILEGEEHLETFWDLLETFLRKAESRSLPDRIWEHYLLRKHFPGRKAEMRRRLYALLGSGEKREVRGLASQYLDELRLKEYRLPEKEGEKYEVPTRGSMGEEKG